MVAETKIYLENGNYKSCYGNMPLPLLLGMELCHHSVEGTAGVICHSRSLPQGGFNELSMGNSPKWKIPVLDMCQQVGGVSKACDSSLH